MKESGSLKPKKNKKTKRQQMASTASKTLLYLGVLILLSSFIYLLSNLEKSDKLIFYLSPFLLAGLGFILLSQLIKRGYKRQN